VTLKGITLFTAVAPFLLLAAVKDGDDLAGDREPGGQDGTGECVL